MNVWFALTHKIHPAHGAARTWADSIESGTVVYFCRLTQLGLQRLLTNQSAMAEDLLTQSQAWKAFDRIMAHSQNHMIEEPAGIDPLFRKFTDRKESSKKQWADGYLAAFAEAAALRLVTFDKAPAGKLKGTVLLA